MLPAREQLERSVAGDLPPLASDSDGTGASAPFVHPRAGTRGYHLPEVDFPPQKCHACPSEEVFHTRTSFTLHLKGHGLFWKDGSYAQLRRTSGGGGPAARGIRRSGPSARGQSHSPATSAVRPTPQPLMSLSFPGGVRLDPSHSTSE